MMAGFRKFFEMCQIINLTCSRPTIICLPYFSFQSQSSMSPSTVFLAVVWDARMACLHVFCCIAPSLLVFCRGIFGDSFQALPELCASCSPPPPGSPAVWPCLHFLGPVHPQSLGPPDGCLYTLVRAGTFLPLLLQLSPMLGTTLPSTLAFSC